MTLGRVLAALLALWVALAVIGLVIRGLFVLFLIALVAFGFTLAREGYRRGIFRR